MEAVFVHSVHEAALSSSKGGWKRDSLAELQRRAAVKVSLSFSVSQTHKQVPPSMSLLLRKTGLSLKNNDFTDEGG